MTGAYWFARLRLRAAFVSTELSAVCRPAAFFDSLANMTLARESEIIHLDGGSGDANAQMRARAAPIVVAFLSRHLSDINARRSSPPLVDAIRQF